MKQIAVIQGPQETIQDPGRIEAEFVKYYTQLYQTKSPQVDSLLDEIKDELPSEQKNLLNEIPQRDEITEAIFNMNRDGSPGPDGFSGCFSKIAGL